MKEWSTRLMPRECARSQAHLVKANKGKRKSENPERQGLAPISVQFCRVSSPFPITPCTPPPFPVSLTCFLFTTKALFLSFLSLPSSFIFISSSCTPSCLRIFPSCLSSAPAKGLCSPDERRAKPEPESIRHPFALSPNPPPPPLRPSLCIPSLSHALSLPPSSSRLHGLPRLGSLHFSTRWDGERTRRGYCSSTEPGGEQQKELTRPSESREVGGDPRCLCHHLGTQNCGKTGNWTICSPDGTFNKGDTCCRLSLFFQTVREFLNSVSKRLLLTLDMDPGWERIVWVFNVKGLGCGLECWCGAPELRDVALCSRTTWTCLVSPRCQSCPGECVFVFWCWWIYVCLLFIPLSWQMSLTCQQSQDNPGKIFAGEL